MLRKGGEYPIKNYSTPDILKFSVKKTKIDGKILHYTEKPVGLMKVLIENSTNEGDLVLEPFSGSGSTALACIETNRRYIAFEKNEEYYNGSIRRINMLKNQITLF